MIWRRQLILKSCATLALLRPNRRTLQIVFTEFTAAMLSWMTMKTHLLPQSRADYSILHKSLIVEPAVFQLHPISIPLTLSKTHQFPLSQYMIRVRLVRKKTKLRNLQLLLLQDIRSVQTEVTILSMNRMEPLFLLVSVAFFKEERKEWQNLRYPHPLSTKNPLLQRRRSRSFRSPANKLPLQQPSLLAPLQVRTTLKKTMSLFTTSTITHKRTTVLM